MLSGWSCLWKTMLTRETPSAIPEFWRPSTREGQAGSVLPWKRLRRRWGWSKSLFRSAVSAVPQQLILVFCGLQVAVEADSSSSFEPQGAFNYMRLISLQREPLPQNLNARV